MKVACFATADLPIAKRLLFRTPAADGFLTCVFISRSMGPNDKLARKIQRSPFLFRLNEYFMHFDQHKNDEMTLACSWSNTHMKNDELNTFPRVGSVQNACTNTVLKWLSSQWTHLLLLPLALACRTFPSHESAIFPKVDKLVRSACLRLRPASRFSLRLTFSSARVRSEMKGRQAVDWKRSRRPWSI